MSDSKDYNINLFKPHSDYAKANTKLIFTLLIIWAVAVFGFHFALILLGKVTPEKSYTEFTSVWPSVIEKQVSKAITPTKENVADSSVAVDSTKVVETVKSAPVVSDADKTYMKSLLMVLGKNVAVKENHKKVLKNALSVSLANLASEENKALFGSKLSSSKKEAVALAISLIGLGNDSYDPLLKGILTTSLVSVEGGNLSTEYTTELPKIMELYLTHKRSVLTDSKFLGFPFHYWYSAQFLLILFIVLCIIYAVKIDKLNTKFNIPE